MENNGSLNIDPADLTAIKDTLQVIPHLLELKIGESPLTAQNEG
ncbi:hypothetical protein [Solitalea lacus]|nr:hypothetical protein [Solitalea lacus]